ncbi:hypothetical protein GF326_03070 [Candidatus Bathyarchaeota archaeon]|nr:hypothetical protein [Candidatus Bathyarchaeota archaeon]
MFNEEKYRSFLANNDMSPEKIELYVAKVSEAVQYFDSQGKDITEGSVEDFREYVSHQMQLGENDYDDLMPLGRYVYMMNMKEPWIYYASILGGSSIYPSIKERLSELEGEEVCDTVFNSVDIPSLGSDPNEYPVATKQLMEQLRKQLHPEQYRRVLAGNHHRIPLEWFNKQKQWLMELDGDIDAWLDKMHKAAVADLEEHLREDKVWFEQIITQDIVDYVRSNPELLSGVRRGEWIYNMKFPYAPQDYLDADDSVMKRYYMCHCPLARSAVLTGEPEIPMDWCYCSAGYGKLRYDIAFGEETEVEVLESVFNGSDRCRFRIKIPEKYQ